MNAAEVILTVGGVLVFLSLGSFACVIIDRLPVALEEPNQYGDSYETRPWREVLGGTSRCSSCGVGVRPYDNIPVVSWLMLRGKCRACGERIPAFHPLVELASPVLFLLVVWAIGWDWTLLPLLWLIPVGLAITVIDLRTLIVPTRIVWPAFLVSVALSVIAVAIGDEWSRLLPAFIGALTLSGPLFVIWFIHPRGMGFGDVRLTVLLGWTIGFYAGTRPIAAVVLAVVCLALSSLLGLVLGVVAFGARGRKAQVPFGPVLVTAAFVCAALAPEILEPFGVFSLS